MWPRLPSTPRGWLRELFPPPAFPLSNRTVWTVALTVLVTALLADVLTPASLAVGTVLSASVAFAALGTSKRAVWQLMVLAVRTSSRASGTAGETAFSPNTSPIAP